MNSLFDSDTDINDAPKTAPKKPRKPPRSPHVDRPIPRPIPRPDGASEPERAASAAVLSDVLRERTGKEISQERATRVLEASLYALTGWELDVVMRLTRDLLRSR